MVRTPGRPHHDSQMRRTPDLAAAVAAAAAALVPAAQASAVDNVVATVSRPTPVDVYGGRAVWSAWDSSTGAYRLTEYVNGRVRTVPVAPNAVPFDVDLGPDRRGRALAVYSRCRRPPVTTWQLNGRRGCDLYAYRFSTRRQVRLSRANSGADEYHPTVWRGKLAFTRTYRTTRRLLYWRALNRPGRSRRLAGGGRGGVPEQLDMRSGSVAFVRSFEYGAVVRLVTTGGKARVLEQVPGSGAAANELEAQGPSIMSRNVYWALSVGFDDPVFTRIRRVAVQSGRRQQATLRVDADPDRLRATSGYGHDRTGSWYVRAAANTYEVHRATGLRYLPAGPIELD